MRSRRLQFFIRRHEAWCKLEHETPPTAPHDTPVLLCDLRRERSFTHRTVCNANHRHLRPVQSHVIMDKQSWESIAPAAPPPSSNRRKVMVTPHVGHTKHHVSTNTSRRHISNPTLGIDLRFEQTYLKTIAPHVRLTTPAPDKNEKYGDLVHPQSKRLDIKWGKVIWITARDQVLAPMFQGMIWWVSFPLRIRSLPDVICIYRGTLSPWVQYFRGGSASPSGNGRPSRTGAGIAKLKSWFSSIIPPTPAPSFRTK